MYKKKPIGFFSSQKCKNIHKFFKSEKILVSYQKWGKTPKPLTW